MAASEARKGVCLCAPLVRNQYRPGTNRWSCRRTPSFSCSFGHMQERFEDPEVVYVERADAESGNGAAHADAEHSGSDDGIAEHRGSATKVWCCCWLAGLTANIKQLQLKALRTERLHCGLFNTIGSSFTCRACCMNTHRVLCRRCGTHRSAMACATAWVRARPLHSEGCNSTAPNFIRPILAKFWLAPSGERRGPCCRVGPPHSRVSQVSECELGDCV